jgi:hypothetical protein
MLTIRLIPLLKNSMLSATVITFCCFLYGQSPSTDLWKVLHRKDDVAWSQKTGLPARVIRDLRVQTGISDQMQEGRIENVDIKSLSVRNHILFVTSAGNGHCLSLNVFGRSSSQFRSVWQSSEAPDGSGFCKEGEGNPSAYGRNGYIFVKIPTKINGQLVARLLKYKWDGQTYQPVRGNDVSHYGRCQTRWECSMPRLARTTESEPQ